MPFIVLLLLINCRVYPTCLKPFVHVFCVLAIAEGHKTKGDEEFRKQEYNSSIDFYTKGLQVNCKDEEFNAKLYSGRATSHYLLGMYLKHKLNSFDKRILFFSAQIENLLVNIFRLQEYKVYYVGTKS